jgi:2-polyprenyl-3-methyl-5-hydroxy-6-metoxy-1,4-benzoquinol methylase
VYTDEEFFAAGPATGTFDSLLACHLVEHMTPEDARTVLRSYLRVLRPGGTVVLVTPQERGHASDPTHVAFSDVAALAALCQDLRLRVDRAYSFPFPRLAGRAFTYDEFVVVASAPA